MEEKVKIERTSDNMPVVSASNDVETLDLQFAMDGKHVSRISIKFKNAK